MLQQYVRVIGRAGKEASTRQARKGRETRYDRRYQSPARIGPGVRKVAGQEQN
jgi:hypothetical protein